MLTKQEIYDVLKDDGARLPRAVNFMNRDELVDLYKERFGVDPDNNMEEQPNSDKLSDGDEMQCEEKNLTPQKNVDPDTDNSTEFEIPLLKFDESGWCNELNRVYNRGFYRPVTVEEYNALKKYAAEEIIA